ncbi:F-box domain-containing protein [Favolaschia claudopus]|uniref:F-box domain-containing protein n=1 Tax=Favolaschia claudopus TaxID=2862362 RepID=A0AAW0A333_9AGAR
MPQPSTHAQSQTLNGPPDAVDFANQGLSKTGMQQDPIARLPLELQSEILIHCASSESAPHPSKPPLSLLSISRQWRAIALATPRLWADLRIQSSRTRKSSSYLEHCHAWIQRARDAPLSLALYGDLIVDHAIRDFMHSYKLAHLSLEMGSIITHGHDCRQIEIFDPYLPHLKTLSISVYRGMTLGHVSDWMALLAAAPRLVECTMENIVYVESRYAYISPQPLIHTSLRKLWLGRPWDGDHRSCRIVPTNSAVVLDLTTLPALRDLYISQFDISMNAFISFLVESSPPLESFGMCAPVCAESEMTGCLRLMPTLTSLTLDRGCYLDVLKMLATVPELLPHLRRLTVLLSCPDREVCDVVIGLIGGRTLEAFRLVYCDVEYVADEDVVGALRRFVDGGMEIHFGPVGRNVVQSV